MRKAVLTLFVVLTAAPMIASQSIRLGTLANPQATDDVFVLRHFRTMTNEGYGTVPHVFAVAAQRATAGLADIAVVGIAGGVPFASVDGAGSSMRTSEVTWNALSLLRIRPALGRDFSEADATGGKVFAIVTHATWMTRFGGSVNVIGSRFIRKHDQSRTSAVGEIVGVLPPGVFANTPELDPDTEVLVLSPDVVEQAAARDAWYAPLVRPRPGVTVAQTQAALDAMVTKLQSEGRAPVGFGLRLESLRQPRR